ncbi:hypothetical protein BDY21DRAFT_342487 [Lineolata rhizophorae]|uniref:Acyl-CoA dehydrogenase/oxidase n=1 Tax=Lineolata rhizophorae TaxID=578093 RepID=A0A6A6P3U4_9PEZI|nr:hypothetical protein BDY21DRAFT_342487 [Lineolata rhizophorae]
MATGPAKHTAQPSSGTDGFFQAPPQVRNQFEEDATLRRVFEHFLSTSDRARFSGPLASFADLVLTPKVLAWVVDAETNPPFVRELDTWGRRTNELVTSEGWRQLQALGIREGIVATGHERDRFGAAARVWQFLKYHVWSASSANVTCPSAMTDGAATLLTRHLRRKPGALEASGGFADAMSSDMRGVLEKAYARLVSRDPERAWTSGQWMTERTGGSDVRGTQTLATLDPGFVAAAGEAALSVREDAEGSPLGPWRVDGFKWFSSATDADMTVLLARTPPPDGQSEAPISAFVAPMRRRLGPTEASAVGVPLTAPQGTVLNGVRIQRLKSKLGTRPVPTAELELRGMRAYLLGAPGQGVKEISTVLNITRLHNSASACGYLGRGLSIARAFARVRRSSGRLLADTPAHVKTLAKVHVEYRAQMMLTYLVAMLLGRVEYAGDDAPRPGSPPSNNSSPTLPYLNSLTTSQSANLLRALTPVMKALTARIGIYGLQECTEALGGVGYLESPDPNANIVRLLRDACVLSIWEGTTDVMGDDFARAVKGRGAVEVVGALDAFVHRALGMWSGAWKDAARAVGMRWERVKADIGAGEREELAARGREMLDEAGWVTMAILLVEDARRDGDAMSAEVARRWVAKKESVMASRPWNEEAFWDKRIVFGDGEGKESARL